MRVLILFSILILSCKSEADCIVGIPDDCPTGRVCAKFNSAGESKCFDVPQVAPVTFEFPFDSMSPVFCTQSGRLSKASHVYRNMLYAIDLATLYKNPASVVRAAAPGKAFVVNNCPNLPGKPEQTKDDPCGLGYGNHVKLLHKDGYISIYAHLAKVEVKTGDVVKARQRLGIEGATGKADMTQAPWTGSYLGEGE